MFLVLCDGVIACLIVNNDRTDSRSQITRKEILTMTMTIGLKEGIPDSRSSIRNDPTESIFAAMSTGSSSKSGVGAGRPSIPNPNPATDIYRHQLH